MEAMKHEALLAEELVDVRKQRLPDIHRQEFDFRLDHDAVCQPCDGILEHHQLAALDIDLQIVHPSYSGDIVETNRVDLLFAYHPPPLREAMKQLKYFGIGLQQRRHACGVADTQRVLLSIADRMRQVDFVGALVLFELRQGVEVGVEADEAGGTARQQCLVGRITIDRIPADIHDLDANL